MSIIATFPPKIPEIFRLRGQGVTFSCEHSLFSGLQCIVAVGGPKYDYGLRLCITYSVCVSLGVLLVLADLDPNRLNGSDDLH